MTAQPMRTNNPLSTLPNPRLQQGFASRPFAWTRTSAAAALMVLLNACTTVALPPWPPEGVQQPPAEQTPGMADPTAATVLELPDPLAILNDNSAWPAETPDSPAVAAHFPAPPEVYDTPGLQAGRNSFTSNAETQAWLYNVAATASRLPGLKAAVLPLGQSQRGEALEALILTREASTDAATLRASARPTVLLVGGQHGDEPAGSEALLIIARELTQGRLQALLGQINVIIVPRANPDGAANRQHLTASGVDLDRDHLLLSTPEARALAQLTRDYHPMVIVDAHEYPAAGPILEKFGGVQKYDALLQYATTANLPEFLTKAAEEWFRRPVVAALNSQGLTSDWYYTTSADPADKRIAMGGPQADSLRNVGGLKNTVSLLIETRGVGLGRQHLQRRVYTHVVAITRILASTAQRASELEQLIPFVEQDVPAQACQGGAVVQAVQTPAPHELFLLDPLTGADQILRTSWDSSLLLNIVKARVRPCGYWLSAASREAVERLRLQGVQMVRVTEPGTMLGDIYDDGSLKVDMPKSADATPAGMVAPALKPSIEIVRGVIDAPIGSYYLTMNQPLANLLIAALEPDSPSSYFASGMLSDLGNVARVMSEPSITAEKLDWTTTQPDLPPSRMETPKN